MPRLELWGQWELGGLGFRVRGDDRRLAKNLLRRWSRLARWQGPQALCRRYDVLLRPRRKRLVSEGKVVFTGRSSTDVLDALELTLGQAVARVGAGVPLHAAGVVDRRGRAWLLLGSSGAGKSSASAALLERPEQVAGLLSDEQVYLDREGSLTGYPRALWFDEEEREQVLTTAQVVRGPCPPGGIVALGRPRRPAARPHSLSPAEAAARLVGVCLREPSPEDLSRLTALAAAVPAWSLACDGIAAQAAALAELFAQATW